MALVMVQLTAISQPVPIQQLFIIVEYKPFNGGGIRAEYIDILSYNVYYVCSFALQRGVVVGVSLGKKKKRPLVILGYTLRNTTMAY